MRMTPRGGTISYGRSDTTINRHGVRMGTAEIYRAIEVMPEIADSIGNGTKISWASVWLMGTASLIAPA